MALRRRLSAHLRRGIAAVAHSEVAPLLQAERAARLAAELHTAERLDGSDALRGEVIEALEAVRERVASLEPRIPPLEKQLTVFRSLPYMTSPLEEYEAPAAGRVLGRRDFGGPRVDEYLAFEAVFRGPEDRIREAQIPYLAVLGDRAPILDVGCGRGELLDLLRKRGVPAQGVDMDADMVARCAAKGHDAEVADAITYLEGVPEHSLGAVVAMQVIEHLAHERLSRLLELAHRALKPGGLLIAETVNPHAPQALKGFWLDLTHEHPIFPEVAITLCGIAGFASAYVFHPGATGAAAEDRWTSAAYAVVAEKA